MIAGMLAMLWLGKTIANLVLQSGKRRRTNKDAVLFGDKRWSDGVEARVQGGFYVQIGSYQSILLAVQSGFLSSRAQYRWSLPGSRHAFNFPRYDVLGLLYYNNVESSILCSGKVAIQG